MKYIPEIVVFATVVLSILIFYGKIKYMQYRDRKNREISAYLDIISSLTPGSMWIEREDHLSSNPFIERYPSVVTIIETRIDIYGKLWVAYKLTHERNHAVVAMACDFVDGYKLSTNEEDYE